MDDAVSQPARLPGRLTDALPGAERAGQRASPPFAAMATAVTLLRAHAERLWTRFGSSEIAKGVATGLAIGAFAWTLIPAAPPPSTTTAMSHANASTPPSIVRVADFGDHPASPDVRTLAQWVAATGDAGDAGFVVVDKRHARLHVFGADARLRASTPILLGGARGDHTVPGIGSRDIADVRPEERTTPAGRFVGERGRNARGEDVVWVDYDSGVSIHRVLTTDPAERRLQRLATPTHEDNRISWGCINVPVAFYEAHVRPAFASRRSAIYVLPEVLTLAEVFGLPAAGHEPALPDTLARASMPHDIQP
jgi:hypothetical protein